MPPVPEPPWLADDGSSPFGRAAAEALPPLIRVRVQTDRKRSANGHCGCLPASAIRLRCVPCVQGFCRAAGTALKACPSLRYGCPVLLDSGRVRCSAAPMRCAHGPTKALPVAAVLVRRGRRNTVSPGPRTVRRPSDFWCPGMSPGAAPSSGQARSTQKAGFEFRQWACLQTAVVIRLNVKPYKTPHDSACGGRPRAGVAAGSRPCPCGLPVPVDVAARRCRLRPCLWRSPGRQAP